MNIEELVAGMGKEKANLEKVEASLFDVVKLQLHPNIDGFNSPDAYGVYKGTGGDALGKAGKVFDPMQPKELLANIIHTSQLNNVDLDMEKLTFKEFNGGKNVEFMIPLPSIEFTNVKKVNDITNIALSFSTSYDGTKSNLITLHTERLLCENGMRAWGVVAQMKGKNTTGGKKKILTYSDEVMKIMAGTQKFKEKLEALDKIQIKQADVNAYMTSLLGYDVTDTSELHPTTMKVLDKINSSIALEFERTGETMFGLLNGITHYTNHIAERPADVTRDEYIRFRSGAKLNDEAQRLAFLTLN